jgi:putative metallohydrolase (TIGR04338 family)
MDRPRAPRDAQRARVYRAELPMPSSPLPGLDACSAYAERVVGTLWWQARFPDHTLDRVPRFRPGNGARQAFFAEHHDGEQTITLPRRYRTKGVVLHELAHWALFAQPDLPHHGGTFTRLLLDATAEFLGIDRADLLAEAYRCQRVRVGRDPRVGPDGRLRYGWDERLRLGRDRDLTVRWLAPEGSADATGTFVGFDPGGATVRLRADDAIQRIPTRAVWSVEAAHSAAGAPAVPR